MSVKMFSITVIYHHKILLSILTCWGLRAKVGVRCVLIARCHSNAWSVLFIVLRQNIRVILLLSV